MAKEQPNVNELLPLLESSDLHQLEEVKTAINDYLSSDRGSLLLNGLVDFYIETSSSQAVVLLCSVREPHDKHLFDKLHESLGRPPCRLAALFLLGHVIRRQPPWIHKIIHSPLLASVLKCLKTDCDVMVLITGVLVLITLLPMIPQAGRQHIYDFFDIFGRLASWSLKNPGHVNGVYLIHLHASVYSLFHRLYGMYPCNFVSYLRSHYSMKENLGTYEEVVKPMLEHVRVHPELVTGTQDYELDPSRWKRFEVHDIMIQCAKVSLDPKESSCEEGYSSMPDHVSVQPHQLQLRHLDSTMSPYSDLHNSYGSSTSTPLSVGQAALSLSLPHLVSSQASLSSPQTSFLQSQNSVADSSENKEKPTWSPSTECGMTTPPTSRGISPANASELPLASRTHGGVKGPVSAAPSSHAATLFDEYDHISLPSSTSGCQQMQQPIGELERGVSQPIGDRDRSNPEVINNNTKGGERVRNMSLTELSDFIKEQDLDLTQEIRREGDEDSITEELTKLTKTSRNVTPSGQTGSDGSVYDAIETLTGRQGQSLSSSSQSLNRDPQCRVSTPDRGEGSASTAEYPLFWSLQPCFTPIDSLLPGGHSLYRGQEEEDGSGMTRHGQLSPSPFRNAAPAYEPLFELALPRAASLFVSRKTREAAQKAKGELQRGGGEGEGVGERMGEWEEVAAVSPLEVLDHLIQQGHEAHVKFMKRVPIPNKLGDWTHIAGSTPQEEVQTLRSQLLLLHNQLLFERYKREQHAIRNRRLLRRIINATAMEEQNNSMKAQLKLQEVEIQSLQTSLQTEQQRHRQLKQDTHTETSRLHSQIQLLQQQHREYCTRAQKLQNELQECQSRMKVLEAELQMASYEADNTGHQLTQLSLKLSNSEELQQQMYMLNKQLLLLSETNKLCIEEVQRVGPESKKEMRMLQWSLGKEAERLRQGAVQQSQRLEAAQQRLADFEVQLAKKDHLILQQKKFLEDIKAQAKGQLQASESRYVALRCVTQALQTEMLQLYSQLDLETKTQTQASNSDPEPVDVQAGGRLPSRPSGSSSGVPMSQGNLKSSSQANSEAQESHFTQSSTTVGTNGSLHPPMADKSTPRLTPPLTHLLASSSLSLSPVDSPLAVGSYPSEKSFLGMHARELFRNKSDSQFEEEVGVGDEAVAMGEAQLSSLSLETEQEGKGQAPDPGNVQFIPKAQALAPDPPRGPIPAPSDWQGAAPVTRHRRDDLTIMDYNETRQENS